ncbi:MAG: hypothetical protein QOH00_2264, partial [Gaiellales bacterium]|nr:hypothetical protein [Gaiellales bacterium]
MCCARLVDGSERKGQLGAEIECAAGG